MRRHSIALGSEPGWDDIFEKLAKGKKYMMYEIDFKVISEEHISKLIEFISQVDLPKTLKFSRVYFVRYELDTLERVDLYNQLFKAFDDNWLDLSAIQGLIVLSPSTDQTVDFIPSIEYPFKSSFSGGVEVKPKDYFKNVRRVGKLVLHSTKGLTYLLECAILVDELSVTGQGILLELASDKFDLKEFQNSIRKVDSRSGYREFSSDSVQEYCEALKKFDSLQEVQYNNV